LDLPDMALSLQKAMCGLFLAFFATLTMSRDLRIISSLPTMAS
jgi:hypothetical protein